MFTPGPLRKSQPTLAARAPGSVPAIAAAPRIAWAETEAITPALDEMLNVMDFEPSLAPQCRQHTGISGNRCRRRSHGRHQSRGFRPGRNQVSTLR